MHYLSVLCIPICRNVRGKKKKKEPTNLSHYLLFLSPISCQCSMPISLKQEGLIWLRFWKIQVLRENSELFILPKVVDCNDFFRGQLPFTPMRYDTLTLSSHELLIMRLDFIKLPFYDNFISFVS